MQAGDVSVRLLADVAQFQRQMARAEALVQQTSANMISAFRGLAAPLAAAFSLGAIVQWTRAAIDAADKAGKLAQTIGVATEQVAGLQLAFRQSGLAAEQLGPVMSKLAAAIANGNKALNAMQVATRNADGSLRSTRDVLGDVAQRFAGYQDGAAKTALAVALLGEEGAKLVPLLNGGAAGLGDMDAKARALGLTLDSQAAAAAAKFNDELDLFRARAQGFAQTVALKLLPTLNNLVRQLNDGAAAYGSFWDATIDIGLRVDPFASLDENLAKTVRDILTYQDIIAELNARSGPDLFGRRAEQIKKYTAALEKAIARERYLLNQMRALGGRTAAPGTGTGGQTQPPTLNTSDPLGDFLRNVVDPKTRARELAAAQREAELMADRELQLVAAYEAAEEAATAAHKAEMALFADRELKAIAAYDAAEQAADAVVNYVASIERETEALKLSNTEREIHNALLELERLGIQKGTAAYDEYAQRIREAVIGREAVRESIDQARSLAQQWKTITDQIGQSLTDALINGGMKARDFIKALFKTMVLRPVIQAVITPVMGAIGGAMGMTGAASASTGGGGVMGGLGTGLQMAGAYGSLAGAGAAMTLAGNTGMALSAAGAAMSAGSVGAGLSIGIGAIAPYALAAIAVVALLKRRLKDAGIEGTFGPNGFSGNTFNDWSGNLFLSSKTSRSPIDSELQRSLSRTFEGLRNSVSDMAGVLNAGGSAIDNFTTSVRISTKGLNEEQVQQALQKQFEAIGEELAALALGTTTEIVEMVETVRTIGWDNLGEGVTREITETVIKEQRRVVAGAGAYVLREGETAMQALQRLSSALSAVNPMLDLLGIKLFDASIAGADLASQLTALFGGDQAFVEQTGAYYQTFYTEAERAANTTRLLTAELASLGYSLPTTRNGFRALVDAQDLTTESGRQTFATLIQMSAAFATISPELDALATSTEEAAEVLRSAADIANERAGLERQLLELQGDTVAIRALERAALDESNRALYDQITTLQDTQAAAAAAAQAEADLAAERERIAQERSGLERQLLELQGDTVAIRALERAALDESNRALYDQITALQDTQAAAAAAAQAEADLAAERERLVREASSVTDAAFDLVRRAIEAEAETARSALTAAFETQIQSIEQQQQAATAARDAAGETLRAATDIFKFLGDQVASLRGAVGAGMSAAAGQRFISDAITAARVTGTLPDREALAEAVAAARGALDPTFFGSAFEQQRATRLLANSLDDLQQVAGSQISTAEAALRVAEDQLEAMKLSAADARSKYDEQIEATRTSATNQLAAAQAQLDALRGIDTRILTVADALLELSVAVAAEGVARAAAASSPANTSSATSDVKPSVTSSVRSAEQLANMLPSDWYTSYKEAEKIDWFNANRVTVPELLGAGVTQAEVDYLLRPGSGYQGFANGGLHAGGLRMVGELGPEMEVTGPARYYSTSQTQSMLGGGAAVADELRQLREENRAQARALVQLQSRMTRLLERWDGDGLPEERAVAA